MSEAVTCTSCGGELSFAAGTTSLSCPYCGAHQEIAQTAPETQNHNEELDYSTYIQNLQNESTTIEVQTTHCNGCNAHLTISSERVSDACPYCGSNIILSERHAEKLIAPRGILPFGLRSKKAQAAYLTWVKKRWFAPNDFKRTAKTHDRLAGIYLPYWTYDAKAITSYSGKRGTVHRNKKNTTVSWKRVSGVVYDNFDDTLVVASESLTHKYVDRLEPWDLENLKPFNNDYLRGFRAEQYQVDLPQGFEEAKGKMEKEITKHIKRDIGGDRQQISDFHPTFSDVTFKHILLPVWVTAYRYKSKVYQTVINARTGEVQGERPWSIVKLTLAGLGAVLAAGTAYFFGN